MHSAGGVAGAGVNPYMTHTTHIPFSSLHLVTSNHQLPRFGLNHIFIIDNREET